MLCLWRLTFNQERRSLDGFTSTKAPIHAVVRATARVGGIARLNVSSGGVAYSVGFCRHQAWINRFPTIFRAVMPSLCKYAEPNGATGRSLSNSGLRPR